jgi:nicotinate dehydrogenase subunit A
MARTALKINGRQHVVDIDPECPLLYVLRDTLALNNPRFGCGLGQCGACTVLVDNRAIRSCTLPASRAVGREIVTIEGLATSLPGGHPHPIQRAFIDEQAFQCGYCLNGWVLTAKALLDRTPQPTERQVLSACQSLICRCGSHTRIFAAIQRASKEASGGGAPRAVNKDA